ncbi:MAG: LacI family DNA-binding transcriptional regulator [Opitutaceae bacterium]|nr:LacI family DNA-binding transcriptional regulator [Opitutaceae bacterium]
MVTLKQIAAELGVSHTLVSCVASGRMGNTRVSEATRQAILARIEEVGFQPNRLALALKGGHKGYVGVFLHKHGTYGSEMNEHFISAISDSLAERGLGLWLRFFTGQQEFLDACSNRLLKEVDGLVVAGIAHPELHDKLRTLQTKGFPIVCAFAGWAGELDIPNVYVDAERQGWLAANHLTEIGCRRIARIHCHESRQRGFLSGLREAGVEPVPALMIPSGDFGYNDGLRCIDALVRSGEPFDGISADSDALAAASVHYLLRNGRPRETWPKIVGVDDSPIAKHCAVPLTSVSSEISERARCVVKTLFERIDGQKVGSTLIVPQLVVRESTNASLCAPYFVS